MEKLDHILQSHVVAPDETEVKNKLLAAGLILVDRNGILYSNAEGRLGFDANSPAYTTDSMSWIASMTKLITATCVLQLVERGLVGIDEDVRPKVPQLAAMQILRGFDDHDQPILEDNTKPITVRHLLSHTLGLGYDLADPDLNKWSASVGRTDNNLHWTLAGFMTPLKFAPGEGWYYGAAYDWAGHLLTIITGQPLSVYMQKHIFDALGMDSTTFWPKQILGSGDRMLQFAFRDDSQDGDPKVLEPGPTPLPEEHEMESGGAGLFSTPGDYAKFLHATLTHKLLSKETTNLLFEPQLNETQRGMLAAIADWAHEAFTPEFPLGVKLDHGLGGVINVEDVEGKRRRGSMMWSGMSNGRWWIDRETGVAAAIFTCVLPHGNKVLTEIWDEVERFVYGELMRK
ncbi:beta-lactamase/transpeptidase-like protein [Pseudomassariella vexata]|uniref:Beta-lactamase/transpeptidase-like protein n=1 Tax=Pseudomassariella vexata TaxID=1141098 RepID=A0A1Y2DSZ9_9PEZI|nr:beta-lactamase/transpeptidase-like protein [Pseudomassariella vexata]ORY62391.1 beta-lactamase/transpeptidase-like protein [Pseudomassariella vexata]